MKLWIQAIAPAEPASHKRIIPAVLLFLSGDKICPTIFIKGGTLWCDHFSYNFSFQTEKFTTL
jgi:hypothetical protein